MSVIIKILFLSTLSYVTAPNADYITVNHAVDSKFIAKIYGYNGEAAVISVDVNRSQVFAGVGISHTDTRSTLSLTCFHRTLGINVDFFNTWFSSIDKEKHKYIIEMLCYDARHQLIYSFFTAIFQIHEIDQSNNINKLSIKLSEEDYGLFLTQPFNVTLKADGIDLDTSEIKDSKTINSYMSVHTTHNATDEFSSRLTANNLARMNWKRQFDTNPNTRYNTVDTVKDQPGILLFHSQSTPTGLEYLQHPQAVADLNQVWE